MFYTVEYLVIHCEGMLYMFHWKSWMYKNNFIYLSFRRDHVIFHIYLRGLWWRGLLKMCWMLGQVDYPCRGDLILQERGLWCGPWYGLKWDLRDKFRQKKMFEYFEVWLSNFSLKEKSDWIWHSKTAALSLHELGFISLVLVNLGVPRQTLSHW